MRAALVLVILSSTALADREDAHVFGPGRERTLDALVQRGLLDRTLRANFPTREVAAREIAKLQVRTKFKKSPNPAECVLTSGVGDLVFQCSEHACRGACQVQRNEAVIRVRSGTWSVTATTAKQLGDTGECGCCDVAR